MSGGVPECKPYGETPKPAPTPDTPSPKPEPDTPPGDLADVIKIYKGADGKDGKDGADGASPEVDYDKIIAAVVAKVGPSVTRADVVAMLNQLELDYDAKELADRILPHLPPLHIHILDPDTGEVLDKDSKPLGGTFKFRLLLREPDSASKPK